ncbi:hypothetical protein C8R43DRAFT_1013724 [Mycena crocata]|nr:hypothetical protein C8R43DRAFT_1013724 [Mycena crocata]
MSISAADILPFARGDDTESLENVRNRLEWTWGLGHNNLDEHLRNFADPDHVLTDETLLLFPPAEIIKAMRSRGNKLRFGVRRPHIQKVRKCTVDLGVNSTTSLQVYKEKNSFEYLVVPFDSSGAAWTLVSQVPPHLVLCTTSGKMLNAWGDLTGKDRLATQASLLGRSNVVAENNVGFALSFHDFRIMEQIHRWWSWVDHAPESFLSEDSDMTMVELEESKPLPMPIFGMNGKTGSTTSSYHEPQRRLLPCELEEDPNFLAIDDDSDDSMSSDSHITGIDDSEEFAKASMARGDYEMDRSWLKGMESWAEGASSGNDGGMLLNVDQIEEDPKEQPRVATSLDLAKPDYLQVSRHKKRTTTRT